MHSSNNNLFLPILGNSAKIHNCIERTWDDSASIVLNVHMSEAEKNHPWMGRGCGRPEDITCVG